MGLLWIYLILINGWSYLLMGWDKRKAQRGEWRVAERTLLLAAAAGGSAGVWAGMYHFRHKTCHGVFRYGIPTLFLLQTILLTWLFSR
ncbi:DUF1294 domain-containing protein [Salinithrix halophila]|uniref:DUF1294 domain-containing protein n=1 Tax=Salinithrix halophila TaxID=1485204 RepID=A0ABV8JCW3_9BACL